MKLEPLFYAKENKLYRISDDSPVELSSLKKIEVLWSQVQIDEDTYNEEFLANLRETLKGMEAAGEFAVLVPVADRPLETPEQEEEFITAFNHCARRIKDCISVAGFELAAQLKDKNGFMETLAVKHAQYIYFSRENDTSNKSIVLY